ncbi:MAG: S9 family peptidase [Ferruginibacter sp.]
MKFRFNKYALLLVCCSFIAAASAQFHAKAFYWSADGSSYTKPKDGGIVKIDPKTDNESVLIRKEQLTPAGTAKSLNLNMYYFSPDKSKLLIFTNTARVWRYNTKGDYWVLDIASGKLQQLGNGRPAKSLMFAKFSPDGKKVAYVSDHNIFSEDLTSGRITQLTYDGTRKLINGTFDWVYEEEFGCRDGFRWSPDGTRIAFWQVDATKIRDYLMLNTTDSNYSHVVPVEYPKVGEPPSPVRLYVVTLNGGAIRMMNIDGDPQQHYLPRMEWSGNNELIIQQLDRKQQESKLMYCNATDGSSRTFYAENDDAWVEIKSYWNDDDPVGWDWINKGQDFIWVSEKDGYRHIYKISKDGKTETLLTKGNYDIESIKCIDEGSNYVYFMASPSNATQLYLYRVHINASNPSIIEKIKGVVQKAKEEAAELVSPSSLKGMHDYNISPNAKFAVHSFSNYKTQPAKEWISLPDHKPLNASKSIAATMQTDEKSNIEYLQITTANNVTLDAWINKPKNFDPSKKYPVLLEVYGEPAASMVLDSYGNQDNNLYNGDMSADGYFQVAIDNRGTPSLKGAAWRKAIYRKIGTINIKDMAMGFMKLLDERPYLDRSRVAVWGWSGGGSSTLNLLFQYPDVFKTGIAVAAVANQLFYDNIYQERYMGLPQENKEDFIKGSPITYAKNLKGNLLYIHGTGDDNVHYANAEVLVNELIKYNKIFQFMPYPNRTHGIFEGAGTREHLSNLFTTYLKEHCPPGAR